MNTPVSSNFSPNASANKRLERLRELDRERMHIARAAAMLQWDEECCLPPAAVEERAEQLAVLEGLAHDKLVSPELGHLLDSLGEEKALPVPGDGFPADAFVRTLGRDYDRAVKLPGDFVRESARAEGLSLAAWISARKHNDFGEFAPHLEKILGLAKQKAAFWGWPRESLYDGLLDYYEPSAGVRQLGPLFARLGEKLQLLLKKIALRPLPNNAFLCRNFDLAKQEQFCREVMTGLGFDLSRGRLDASAHPFTTTLGFNDVRITTRYAPRDPLSALFSVIHESGHAFYELGLDPVLKSSCLAEGTSMGIHESQSRLWENVIGRSRAFWKPWFSRFAEYFPAQCGGVDFESFYRALNIVKPGLIRVEADELSYSLHIILRFELEAKLIAGTLSVNDLPAAWNAAVKNYLGVECSGDAEGVLQDIHWSMGSFGYFPTYVLGNLYALQFWDTMREDIPCLKESLAQKEYGAVHSWLREKIHRKGRAAESAKLIKEVTGRPLSADSFFNYIERKYTELYEL